VRIPADEPPLAHRDAGVDLRLHRAPRRLGHLLPDVRPAQAAAQGQQPPQGPPQGGQQGGWGQQPYDEPPFAFPPNVLVI
jgi:hypothetical protein